MENSYKVSFIVPVYNLEKLIGRCVMSLIQQTLDGIEIILVNDCSTDGSNALLHQYEKEHNNIRVIENEINLRQGGARNRGIDCAKGEYIIFVDGDDWVEPEMAESLYTYAKQNDCDIVDSDYFQDTEKGETSIKVSIPHDIINSDNQNKLILNGGRLWTKLIKRDLIQSNHLKFIEHKKFEDNPYLPILLAYAKHVGKVEKPFYHYIYNADSTSRNKNDFSVFDRLDTADYLIEEAERRNLYNKYKDEYDYLFIQLYYTNSIIACITKFEKVPIDRVNTIYDNINLRMPGYRRNKYIANAPRYVRVIVSMNKPFLKIMSRIISFTNKFGFKEYITRKAKM